jgi:hypothetical protein
MEPVEKVGEVFTESSAARPSFSFPAYQKPRLPSSSNPRLPSPLILQLAFAMELARRAGEVLPESAYESSVAVSSYIEALLSPPPFF